MNGLTSRNQRIQSGSALACIQSNQQVESMDKSEISAKNMLNVFEKNRVESKDKSVINTQNLKHVFGTNLDLMKRKMLPAHFDNRNGSISYDINDNFDNASAVEFDVGLPSSKNNEIQLFDAGEQVNSREGMNLQFPVSANDLEFDNNISQELKSVMKEKAPRIISDENGLKTFNQIVQKAAKY